MQEPRSGVQILKKRTTQTSGHYPGGSRVVFATGLWRNQYGHGGEPGRCDQTDGLPLLRLQAGPSGGSDGEDPV